MKRGIICLKTVAFILATAFVLLALICALEAKHDCSGESCAVCAALRVAGSAFALLVKTLAAVALAAGACRSASLAKKHRSGTTLVALKVQLTA